MPGLFDSVWRWTFTPPVPFHVGDDGNRGDTVPKCQQNPTFALSPFAAGHASRRHEPAGDSIAAVSAMATRNPKENSAVAGYRRHVATVASDKTHDGECATLPEYTVDFLPVTNNSAEWAGGMRLLHEQPPPPGINSGQWQRIRTTAEDFWQHWAAEASRQQWPTLSLFGIHRHGLLQRVDGMGLVALLASGRNKRIEALTPEKVSLILPTGSRQSFARPHSLQMQPCVPLWCASLQPSQESNHE